MLDRRLLLKKILKDRPENLLVVSGLGSSTWDLTAAGDHHKNFCFIGAMGQAGAFALGLAMAQKDKRILLVTGDGELLMSLGILATIANQAPKNLVLLVMDNESYAETGGQPTATAGPTDLEQVARGCGIEITATFRYENDGGKVHEMVHSGSGPIFINAKVRATPPTLVFPHSFDGVTAIDRFRGAVLSSQLDTKV